MASLMLRAQPFTDADALLPICYRCQATNALLNTQVSWAAHGFAGSASVICNSMHSYSSHCGTCSSPWNTYAHVMPALVHVLLSMQQTCITAYDVPVTLSGTPLLHVCPVGAQQVPEKLCAVQTCLQGDFCTNCGAPFLRSFITFEVLPLVEFELEPGISDAEAAALLGEDVLGSATAAAGGRGVEMVVGSGSAAAAAAVAGGAGGGANVLRLDDEDEGAGGGGFGALGLGRSGALEDSFAAQVRPGARLQCNNKVELDTNADSCCYMDMCMNWVLQKGRRSESRLQDVVVMTAAHTHVCMPVTCCRLLCRTRPSGWAEQRCASCGPARCCSGAGPTLRCRSSGSGCWTMSSLCWWGRAGTSLRQRSTRW